MPVFSRVHSTGTQAIVSQWADGWHIHIDFREASRPMTLDGFLVPTVERAKELADRETLEHGHL